MKHQSTGRKFSRERKGRVALIRTLAGSLILREKIITTEAKAKELRRFIEPLVTRARTNSLAARRLVAERLGGFKSTKKLFNVIAPRFQGRPGGYTRVVKLPPRRRDGAPEALIEFVSSDKSKKK